MTHTAAHSATAGLSQRLTCIETVKLLSLELAGTTMGEHSSEIEGNVTQNGGYCV